MTNLIRRWRLLVALVLLGSSAGLLVYGWPFLTYPTTKLEITLPSPMAASEITHAEAGIAVRDITAPIGIPKFGYSAFAKDADGFRTRLKARAFYLHAPGSTPMAIVQLDLGTGSLPLHHRVAELIATHTDVPAHALSLLVTHTHSGPGNYLGSDFYNVFGSNRAGFDPALFEFLSQQIADAVIAAYQQRRPAKFATGQREIWGYTRNRSLAAWAENFSIPESAQTDALALRAVNPRLSMLRIDLQSHDKNLNECFYPAAALSLFSIHGTAIPAFTSPQHGDVWSWLSREMENSINAEVSNSADCQRAQPFIHGAAQATHADNSPNIINSERGNREAARVGTALAGNAKKLFDQLAPSLNDTLSTAVASKQIDLLDTVNTNAFSLCERAVVGASLIGAANGDEVFPLSYLPYFSENWPRSVFTDSCQGVKQWMISKLQLLLPAERFPHQALIQVVRINELVIVPLPWEVTLESGNRIRDAVIQTLPTDKKWTVEISSLANGYFGYAVTPEEYQRQYYEGGHTLYGPHTVEFLAGVSASLSERLVEQSSFLGDINEIPPKSDFKLVTHSYWPADVTEAQAQRKQILAPEFFPAHSTEAAFWRMRYTDVLPSALALHQPLISIQDLRGATPTTLLDDEQTDLQILLVEQGNTSATYEVRWYNPIITDTAGSFSFRIAARGEEQALHSSAF
ncbi:MAG: neutral/alkaline non-lysosomal ceramidase N-terminal domain-containing protein [Alcanivoracaceae bacterium]|nr:neutral/alkaline non-lysosomal ceramidase N-terminal domain-containing protein [Alcanivoracaceae bacterium]